jgi:hypothetical protein
MHSTFHFTLIIPITPSGLRDCLPQLALNLKKHLPRYHMHLLVALGLLRHFHVISHVLSAFHPWFFSEGPQ